MAMVPRIKPPHDCRSRGDCGGCLIGTVSQFGAASRLPQSRRLRPVLEEDWSIAAAIRLTIAAVAATAASAHSGSANSRLSRLTIAAVAATAASTASATCCIADFRLTIAAVAATAARKDDRIAGLSFRLTIAAVAATAAPIRDELVELMNHRLTIAAVAATAAACPCFENDKNIAASRLPQSRRLRQDGYWEGKTDISDRLTIAAVAATAA